MVRTDWVCSTCPADLESATVEDIGVRKPCLECGEPSDDSRCPPCACIHAASTPRNHARDNERRNAQGIRSSTARGYDSQWRRLSERARRFQPFCSDCGTTNNLSSDHLRWPATCLADVAVVCAPCNNRRGARRTLNTAIPDDDVEWERFYDEWLYDAACCEPVGQYLGTVRNV